MNRRGTVGLGLILAVFAGTSILSCGRKGAAPAGTGGQPKHYRAVYARESPDGRDATFLAADLTDFARPADPAEFTRLFHLPPVMQGETGTCWAFAATSLLESELRRLARPRLVDHVGAPADPGVRAGRAQGGAESSPQAVSVPRTPPLLLSFLDCSPGGGAISSPPAYG